MRRRFLLPIWFLLLTGGSASSQELAREVEVLKEKVAKLERERELPVKVGGNAVLYYQGGREGSEGTSGSGLVANLELTAPAGEGGKLYCRVHAGEGEGADRKFGEDLFANLDTLADDNPESGSFSLLELYYEKEWKRLSLYVGKSEPFILIDTNEYANDEVSQFVGKAFVNNPIIDPEDRFAPMLGIDWKIREKLSFQGVIQSSDKGNLEWNGQEWETGEKSEYEDIFDHPTIAIQLTIEGEGSHYRIYLWYDGAPHPKIDEIEEKTLEPEREKGVVAGVSIDREIREGIGIFARAAYGNEKAYKFNQFYSVGVSGKGVFGREGDIVALGVGALVPSPLYEKQSTEVHLEGYYRAGLGGNVYLTPDLQVVINPGGDGDREPVYAATLRLEVAF